MAQYDQKPEGRIKSVPYGETRASGLIVKDLDKTKDSEYHRKQKRKSKSDYHKNPFSSVVDEHSLKEMSRLQEQEDSIDQQS